MSESSSSSQSQEAQKTVPSPSLCISGPNKTHHSTLASWLCVCDCPRISKDGWAGRSTALPCPPRHVHPFRNLPTASVTLYVEPRCASSRRLLEPATERRSLCCGWGASETIDWCDRTSMQRWHQLRPYLKQPMMLWSSGAAWSSYVRACKNSLAFLMSSFRGERRCGTGEYLGSRSNVGQLGNRLLLMNCRFSRFGALPPDTTGAPRVPSSCG